MKGIIKISREIRRDEYIFDEDTQLAFTWARTQDGHCRRNLETDELNFLQKWRAGNSFR